jgi:hypothetical protein
MNRQEHHDKAEEQADYAARLLQRVSDAGETEDAGIPALSGGQHLLDLARGIAAIAQVHATLANMTES